MGFPEKSLTDFLPMLEDDKIGESDYLFVIRDYLVEHGMKYKEAKVFEVDEQGRINVVRG